MEPIESSETSAYSNTLTPGTYPKVKKLQSLDLAGGNSPSLFQSDAVPVTGLLLNHISPLKVYIHSYKIVYLIVLESELTFILRPLNYSSCSRYIVFLVTAL